MSANLIKLGDVLVAQGDLAGAKQRYQESLEIHKRLSAADPSSASLRRDVSVSLERFLATCWRRKAILPPRSSCTRRAWRSPGACRRFFF